MPANERGGLKAAFTNFNKPADTQADSSCSAAQLRNSIHCLLRNSRKWQRKRRMRLPCCPPATR